MQPGGRRTTTTHARGHHHGVSPHERGHRPVDEVRDGNEPYERHQPGDIDGPLRVDPLEQHRNLAGDALVAVDPGIDLVGGQRWEVEVRDDDLPAGYERRDK